MPSSPRILIVDDEEHIRKILTIMLSKKGYQTETAASAPEALELAGKEPFDVVITDLRMPGMDGLELLRRLKNLDLDLIVIIITAFSAVETAIEAMKQGAYDYISKPFREDEILIVLEKALDRREILAENRHLRAVVQKKYDFSNFIGSSEPMQKVFEIIAKVAETKTTVLISGGSGTGKELAAKSIHFNSPRSQKPFVAINCGAVPGSLLESEFFGYVKGAFSGADRVKKGLFEEADGGTLFLDEVSELPPDLQVKILRSIQEEEIRRLGEAATRKVDLRVIAATNKNLQEEVREGRFREDLYYRLNVIQLNLPDLKDRTEDISFLAPYFLDNVMKKNNLGQKKLSASTVRALTQYHWPGNVRELMNVIEQAAIMSEGPIITPDDLPFREESVSPGGISVSVPEDSLDLKAALKEVTAQTERVIIKRILEMTDQNRTQAAKQLGISRRSLINKIQAYGLDLEVSANDRIISE
ncbi:MAG: sigma-54-dependent Fis family transcriptional regulator [Deltaproteobacteria bacterium]|nr:sigma-54-dependent Fis family transcriptional regulator [Deltaproteobacteria bacterium]MBW2052677.1 sigma-54-dependent Fis family transcriptional regulator [Deltaproteobacteria bacterium]MBW2141836.1 sigma-54-dependent Fis family transcriptional regulator [Deltaproteobacteria bacterium]MBW2323629.1 sigma-54-dependent Fis family transcriptional regulator [Deltaproteobacteria bacterium]